MRRLLHTAAILLIGAQLVAMPAGAPRLVLCLGADGHVALEQTADGASCSTSTLPSRAAEPTAPPAVHPGGDSHCGACVDTPLAPASCPAPAGAAAKQLVSKAVAVASAVSAGLTAPVPARPVLLSAPCPRDFHLALRTTVLLI